MPNDKFFYYTSTDTATKILTNGEIWATNVRFMNDSEEFINGLNEIFSLTKNKLVKECVNDLKKLDYVKYYTISFCRREDALSQWFMYAKESGVSLEIDFAEFDNDFEFTLCDNNSNASDECIKGEILPQKVIYCTSNARSMSEEEKEKAHSDIEKLLYEKCNQSTLKSVVLSGVTEASLLIKRYEFNQENEYRTIINVGNLPYENVNPIFFRIENNVVKSYVKVQCIMRSNSKKMGWPVSSVTIGPGFNQDVVFDSLKLFLDSADLCVSKLSHDHYINRIKKYFNNAAEKINDSSVRNDFEEFVNESKWKFCDEFGEKTFNYQMQKYISRIINESKKILDDKSKKELGEYFDRNYFSSSGIVLKKSMIPYIF